MAFDWRFLTYQTTSAELDLNSGGGMRMHVRSMGYPASGEFLYDKAFSMYELTRAKN